MRKFGPLVLFSILSFAASALCQKDYSIAEVQGSKNVSPHERETVRLSGIVTARVRGGFFIQTPDGKTDTDPATSEGIYVFTRTAPPDEAAVGNLVTVTGKVDEYRARNESGGLPLTELSFFKDKDQIIVVSKGNVLPKPIVLSVDDFKSRALDELEKYEGMRVLVTDFLVVGPTEGRVDIKNASAQSNGVFYGVVKGVPRPFRGPGLDIYEYLGLDEKERTSIKSDHPKLAFFDDNPERLRIESAAQTGSQAIDIPALTELKNVVGVMTYSSRTWTILTDTNARPAIAKGVTSIIMPVATDRQFSVAGMNLENFFDDQDNPDIKEDVLSTEAFDRRLKKVSMAIRMVLQTPDLIGVEEMEDLSTLKRLAARINSDAEATGKPNPKYEAYLIEGNDGRGIDSGFLVKSSRVKVIEVKQLGKNAKFPNPTTNEDNFLFDRPPLAIRVSIVDPKTGQPFEFTAIVNHLKSFLGYDTAEKQDAVRMKKRLQAEFLAKAVQERQLADSAARIMILGDFNAFQFNDGVTDVIGTLKGKPASKDEVLNPSDDLVNPDLIDLVDLIKPEQRYSYTYDGNAQAIDHIIVTDNLKKHIRGFGFARVDADFPEVYRNDDTRVERYSDHDPAIAYFSFDESAPAKTQ